MQSLHPFARDSRAARTPHPDHPLRPRRSCSRCRCSMWAIDSTYITYHNPPIRCNLLPNVIARQENGPRRGSDPRRTPGRHHPLGRKMRGL